MKRVYKSIAVALVTLCGLLTISARTESYEIPLQKTQGNDGISHWYTKHSSAPLSAVWFDATGQQGWAVGGGGTLLQYVDGAWQQDTQGSAVTRNHLYAVWFDATGQQGWAVGVGGTLLQYVDGAWQQDTQGSAVTRNHLTAVWFDATGQQGWAVGVGGTLLQYLTQPIGPVSLESEQPESQRKLDGQYKLTFSSRIAGEPILQLIGPQNLPRLTQAMSKVVKTNNMPPQFDIEFSKLPPDFLESLEGKECRLQIDVTYAHPSFPVQVIYQSEPFYMVADPWWWPWGIVVPLSVVFFNMGAVLLAIPWSWCRWFILHPVGSAALGLIVGKYVVTYPLLRLVRPIRLGLFREYRRQLRDSPAIREWQQRMYVPPSVHLPAAEQQPAGSDTEQWQHALTTILSQPTRRLWLVQGKSGLGKTALLEQWLRYALTLGKTPLLIALGSEVSAQEEARALVAQYGDVEVKPEVAFDLLTGGGFVILLDGFNEDRTPTQTREFVRQVAKRNHVIMTSQIDPHWDRILEIERIELEPFGPKQLKQLLTPTWVDQLLAAKHFADLAQLPYTAQLLAIFINTNQKLPELRLDIYRDLRKNLDADSQILNLEELAWTLFTQNAKSFTVETKIPEDLCSMAVRDGILTRVSEAYRFRHERIHRYFVACYLDRQDEQSLEKWHENIASGLGRDYWADVLELWGELYAERASTNHVAIPLYYDFLREVAAFRAQIFAERLYPQLERLYTTGTLEEDTAFLRWAASKLAPLAAAA